MFLFGTLSFYPEKFPFKYHWVGLLETDSGVAYLSVLMAPPLLKDSFDGHRIPC